ncbi:hypothetical protein CU254_41815 (plasmid) [Amycolatopsis sp. AA4]|uniref:hypothetical protein n=1 Tax=Actinomycetes TaxID=1760 RepID=UPI0001B57145|nr:MULTISPECIES: hypothetical protein [Actinomycetes]ATY17117.1 hypothetical protein CU254_41815 [Amycolatopsis sp. AA4]EFL12650.1 predicted protein [Streptomyces sp. AA4]
MLGYDPDSERHRYRDDVHYRLYRGPDGRPTTICVQDFDYLDYDLTQLLSNKAFDTEDEAKDALLLLLAHCALLLGIFPVPSDKPTVW